MNTFFASLSPTALILLRLLLTVGLIVVFVAIGVLGSLILQKTLRIRLQRQHALRIENRSNFPVQYSLEVLSELDTLQCDFLANGKKLTALTITEESAPPPTPTAESSIRAGGTPSIASKKELKAGVAKVGVFATILSTIGGLLPGSLGQALKSQGDQARAAQANARQAIDAPEEMKNRVSSLSEQSGRLTGQTKPAALAPNAEKNTATQTAAIAYQAALRQVEIKNSALTEVLVPGQGLQLVLRFSAEHQQRLALPLPYLLHLKAIPQVLINDPPLQRELEGKLLFPALPVFRKVLAPAAIVLLGMFCLICFAYFAMLIW